MNKILREYEDIPYTVVGHSSLLEKFAIFLRGEGLKKIVEQMREGEDLRITVFTQNQAKFEIVDTHNKYGGQK